jgi:hypothetical protein
VDGHKTWMSNGHKTKRPSTATAIALTSGCQKSAHSLTDLVISQYNILRMNDLFYL